MSAVVETKPEHVLVATDLSPAGDEAIKEGHRWALLRDARLTVCVVVPNPMLRPLFPHQAIDESSQLDEMVAGTAAVVSDRVISLTGRDPEDVTVRIERGTAYAEILRAAEREQVDLVVVGACGGTGLKRLLLGSTAEKVVRGAHCSVLVARPSPHSGLTVAATDLSDPSFPAVAAGVEYAQRREGKLTILHCYQGDSVLPTATPSLALPVPVARSGPVAREAASIALKEAMSRIHVDAIQVIEEGDAARTIVATAERLDAELIVVGTVGRTGIARLALGSVAEEVVRVAHCSTLVVRLNPDSSSKGDQRS